MRLALFLPGQGIQQRAWVENGFRAILACTQRTGACEAAELHVSSPARGVGGRGLSRGFEEQLQGSKVE